MTHFKNFPVTNAASAMIEGKRVSLADVFKRAAAKAKADYEQQLTYEATPEGAAEKAEREAYHRRMMEADQKFAAENVTTPYDAGREASEMDDPREVPDNVPDDDSEQWLAGYDSIGSYED